MRKYFEHINIAFLGITLVMVTFFLMNKVNSTSLFFLMLIYIYKLVRKQGSLKGYNDLFAFAILFFSLAISLSYSENLKYGWSVQERQLSFLFVPIFVSLIKAFTLKQKQLLLDLFIFSGITVSLFCLSYAAYNAFQTGTIYLPTQKDHFVYNTFMHHRLVAPVEGHAVYFSFYISFAGTTILHHLLNTKLNVLKRWYYILTFIFFCVLIFLLKSAAFAVLFPAGCLLLLVFKLFSLGKISTRLKIGAITTLIMAGIFMYQGVKTKIETFSTNYELSDPHLSPLTMRLAMWECTIDVIKENWLLGVGIGDGETELLQSYEDHSFILGSEGKYNAHNMYLQYWLMAGITALITFIGVLLFFMRKAFKHKNSLFFLLLFFFFGFSLTESTLLTQKGIIFFSFMVSLFCWVPDLWMYSPNSKD